MASLKPTLCLRTGVIVGVLAALAMPGSALAPAAREDLPAQLGFVVFRKTSMGEVTARLGPGKVLPAYDPDTIVGRGWYDPEGRVFLLLHTAGDDAHRRSRLKGSPGILIATLATASHMQGEGVKVGDLGRSRLALATLKGPRGIGLGDSREGVFRALGPGQLQGRRGDIETYNYYELKSAAPGPGLPGGGLEFVMQVTFTAGRLTKIHILELS